jgi:hypothetical protein
MSEQEILEQKPDTQHRQPSRFEERQARRAARRADRQAGGLGWIAGVVFIAIGILYLLQEFDFLPTFNNWWALFLLLPGVGVLSAAVGAYRRNGGRWTAEVTGLVLGGLLFVLMTAVFLFELNYNWFVPLVLIGAGLLMLFRPFFGQTPK